MCGARSSWRFWASVVCFSLCWGSLQAEGSVTIPKATWDEIVLRVNLLGEQLDTLTRSEKLLQEKRIAERTAYETALRLRDERIQSLSDSLTRSTRESKLKGQVLIGETVALVILGGVTVYLLTR